MTKPIPTPPLARAIERDLFGALLGLLTSTLIARLLLLVFELPEVLLAGLLMLGAAGGAFVAHYGSRWQRPSPSPSAIGIRGYGESA